MGGHESLGLKDMIIDGVNGYDVIQLKSTSKA